MTTLRAFIFFAYALNLLVPQVKAQTHEAKIHEEAQKMATAFTEGNYDILMDLTYPKIVEMMGGREAMETTIKKTVFFCMIVYETQLNCNFLLMFPSLIVCSPNM